MVQVYLKGFSIVTRISIPVYYFTLAIYITSLHFCSLSRLLHDYVAGCPIIDSQWSLSTQCTTSNELPYVAVAPSSTCWIKLTHLVVFSRASLQRSSRTRTRKNTISVTTNNESLPSRSSSIASRRKTRPPPLQIIPELSENEFDIDVSPTDSPTTARPTQFPSQQIRLDSSRITLSAYTFSIDDALLMFGDDAPRSPALSVSSSTSDGASSEDVPATPGTSDEEDVCGFILSIPRLRPQRVSVRPLQITKTRSMICQDDEDILQCFEQEDGHAVTLPSTQAQPGVMAAAAVVEEAGEDFYAREFEGFISLSPVVPFHSPPARRDSFTLVVEALPVVIDVPRLEPRSRSRHSKPLPLIPPATSPVSSFPLMFPLVQTAAHTSVVRRKRNVPPHCNSSPPASPDEARPLPQMLVPMDVEDCTFPEEDFNELHGSIVSDYPYSPSLAYAPSGSIPPLPPAIPETPFSEMYGDELLPRLSTDSDSSRFSTDSTSSLTSSFTSNTPTSPTLPCFECPESEDARRLRSRWSSSTLATVAADPPRTGKLFSPLRNVLGSRVRRMPAPKVLPQMSLLSKYSKSKQSTPSPPSTPGRLSTSSEGRSSSECESRDGSPGGLHRKPIPMLMFLRSTQ